MFRRRCAICTSISSPAVQVQPQARTELWPLAALARGMERRLWLAVMMRVPDPVGKREHEKRARPDFLGRLCSLGGWNPIRRSEMVSLYLMTI